MRFGNIEIHNCKELQFEKENNCYKMCRIPLELNEKIPGDGFFCSGIELRFVPIDDEVKITLKTKPGCVARPIVYYGSIQSGWQNLYKNVYDKPTEIIIPKPDNLEFLKKVTKESNLPFSPEVIRVVLPSIHSEIISVQGKCMPPSKEHLPDKVYLAYGSSITHGSLAMVQPNTYVSRIGEAFGADVYNLGFPGTARLEKEVADYIANECEFDFATLEMGVNILDMPGEEYESRVRYFVDTIAKAHPDKKIFCIDVFYMSQDLVGVDTPQCHPRLFREILERTLKDMNLPNVIYINGLNLLTGSYGLSQDGVHPNARGCEEIAKNLTEVIKENLIL